jgi:AAA15 family ATPase/GTPase
MKNLIFKEVSILSKVEKAARTETFDPRLNLLTGENDVGKSTLIKSLYHTLGTDVPGLQNARWRTAKPIYCVRFEINGTDYTIVRDEKYFGAFDANNKLLGKFVGITGERGFSNFMNPLLNFRIELERAENGQLGRAGPAFYFLPYYVDQDEGWTKSWASFSGLQQFSLYRKNMLEYHLGVRPQSYYDAKKRYMEINEEKSKLEIERVTLSGVRDSYQKRKTTKQVDLDPAVFRKEAEDLVDQYNQVYELQQKVVQDLKDIRNERHILENEILVLRRAIMELDADYTYAEDPETPDQIACPTCGTEIANSILERFGILNDIDYCYELIDQRKKKVVDVTERLEAAEEEYRLVADKLAPIEEVLQRKRENVTFAEFVSSEGYKDIMSSLSADINGFLAKENELREVLQPLQSELKIDASLRKEINEHYQARMKEFLSDLSVNVLEVSDYKTFDRQIKINALGSDLPRSLLAQCFSFLHTMTKFNSAVACPLVLDSPLQQEQDADNINAIFKLIFSKLLPQQQLILGTLTTAMTPPGLIPASAKVIHLTEELHLLQPSLYREVLDKIGKLHHDTLATD